jgi:hypothetical protein
MNSLPRTRPRLRDSIASLRAGPAADRQGGQVLVLFALSLVLILVCASIAIDVSLLRNDRQTLVNAVDAGALAGGTLMPVDGSTAGALAKVNALVTQTVQATYPGLPASAFTISYRCLVGVTTATPPKPYIARDIPGVCDPSGALGWTSSTSLASKEAAFQGAGSTRYSACDPSLGDKCNVVVVDGEAVTNYSFGRVVGVDSRGTGVVSSAACNGPCGESPAAPVDLVVLLDRTASMTDPQIVDAREALRSILKIYDPALQRVALGFLGPSEVNSTCSGSPSVSVNAIQDPSASPPSHRDSQSASNPPPGTSTLVVNAPSGIQVGDVLVAGIVVQGGTGVTVTRPGQGTGATDDDWQQIRRTDNGTNISLITYYRVVVNKDADASADEPGSFTWNFSPDARASGGISLYRGVDTGDPIEADAGNTGNDTSSPYQAVAPSLNTGVDEAALLAFFAVNTAKGGSSTNYWSQPNPSSGYNGMTERFDRQGTNPPWPSISGTSKTDSNAGMSGTTTANAADGGQWAAQHVVLRPDLSNSYGTTYPGDLAKWIPIGFTGTDSDSPTLGSGVPNGYNEAYVDANGNLNSSTHIVKAINCFDHPGGTGTNLTTPVAMAAAYLQQYGRPNVKWGIIFETDGQPSYGNTGDPANYTCAAAVASANAAKSITNATGTPIELFTVGFLAGSDPDCPDSSGTYDNHGVTKALKDMASTDLAPSSDGEGDNDCTATENTDKDHFFCEPDSADLEDVFSAIAAQFAGIRSHLIQLYPPPAITAVNPTTGTHLGGTAVTITGKYFTGTTSVKFGATSAAAFSVNSDTSITAVAPAGSTGSTVDIQVTTPGGSSPIVVVDRFTYN